MDQDDLAAAEKAADTIATRAVMPELWGMLVNAYLVGVREERERTNPVFWGMARRIAAQSDLLTRKAKRE